MKRIVLTALCLTVSVLVSCTSSTQTCRASGLTQGEFYSYQYNDSDGVVHSGYNIQGDQNGYYTIGGVDSGIDCRSINIYAEQVAELEYIL